MSRGVRNPCGNGKRRSEKRAGKFLPARQNVCRIGSDLSETGGDFRSSCGKRRDDPRKNEPSREKTDIFRVMEIIKNTKCRLPVALGDVLVKNISDDADLIVSGNF